MSLVPFSFHINQLTQKERLFHTKHNLNSEPKKQMRGSMIAFVIFLLLSLDQRLRVASTGMSCYILHNEPQAHPRKLDTKQEHVHTRSALIPSHTNEGGK